MARKFILEKKVIEGIADTGFYMPSNGHIPETKRED
jgi:hypothetical protein